MPFFYIYIYPCVTNFVLEQHPFYASDLAVGLTKPIKLTHSCHYSGQFLAMFIFPSSHVACVLLCCVPVVFVLDWCFMFFVCAVGVKSIKGGWLWLNCLGVSPDSQSTWDCADHVHLMLMGVFEWQQNMFLSYLVHITGKIQQHKLKRHHWVPVDAMGTTFSVPAPSAVSSVLSLFVPLAGVGMLRQLCQPVPLYSTRYMLLLVVFDKIAPMLRHPSNQGPCWIRGDAGCHLICTTVTGLYMTMRDEKDDLRIQLWPISLPSPRLLFVYDVHAFCISASMTLLTLSETNTAKAYANKNGLLVRFT